VTGPKSFKPNWLSPPGDTIQDALDEVGISRSELARRIGLATEQVNELIQGETRLTPDIAVSLELILGEPARFWLQREANYQQRLARQRQIE
jgi:HTH-type transcriptional regulator / antitoxin HigA